MTSRFASFLRSLAVSCILLASAGARLHAASTGTAELLTPQGNTAGTANGDYISNVTSGGGLQLPYHFWIEVPSGMTRLIVDIFDADVGEGGLGEDVLGRDRERANGDPYTTSATYAVFNPTPTAQTTVYTTGNTTTPTNGDNAWTTLFQIGNNVRDNFGTAAYSNNDGNNNWTGNWTEPADGGSATAGNIQVVTNQLRLAGNNVEIFREADLLGTPGLAMTTARLRLSFTTSGNLSAGEGIDVEVSGNGGGSWTNLETFSDDSTGTRDYDISAFIADNTRVRFRSDDMDANEFFFLDDVRIEDGVTSIPAGHWELRLTMNGGDDINALGIRAHDGTSGSGGTELNMYADTFYPIGVNPDPGANDRNYTHYPYMTSGCTAGRNDFDYDSNSGDTGTMTYTSRTGAFSQSFTSATLAGDDAWNRDNLTGWPSDTNATDYGIWSVAERVSTYGGGPSGNYTVIYMSAFNAAANPPTANPMSNTLRTYFASDAGTAPAKPYLEQMLRFSGCGLSGPNPPVVGQTSCFTTTVRIVNPTSSAITFSATNLVTVNVVGGAAVYGGGAQTSQGSIVSQPSVGGSGNITWNPGSVAAGATALLSYRLNATPTSGGQRILMTNTPGSGNGTRAVYVDETGNTTQTRATYTQGPLCELAVTEGLLTPVVVSAFSAKPGEHGGVVVEWETSSEAGTAGFRVYRRDEAAKRWVPLQRGLLAALQSAPQGGTYRFLDEGAQPGEALTYQLEEVESGGGRRFYGPYRVAVDRATRDTPLALAESGFERSARAGAQPSRAVGAATAASTTSATTKIAGAKDGVWLGVDETGVYKVTLGQLASWFGVSSAEVKVAIADGKMSLRRGGSTPVSWYPDYGTGGIGRVVVNPTSLSGIFFYGVASPTLYSKVSPYRLEYAADGRRMSAFSVDGAATSPASDFGDRARTETDAFAATVLPLDPSSDYWFWGFVQGGDATFGHATFSIEAPGEQAAAGGTLYLDAQGATSGTFGGHDVSLTLNGTALAPIGGTTWKGIAPMRVAFAVPSGVLQPSGNQVEVTAGGTAGNIFYVDGFDLDYARSFAAVGDALRFTVWPLAGGARVSGFTSNMVRLLDVSDENDPRWLTGASLKADKQGAYDLSFAPSSPGTFVAAGPWAWRPPVGVREWHGPAPELGEAELLVVAPGGSAWATAAERLADLRRGEGLSVRVADLDEIADVYGGGIATPQALRAAIAAEHETGAGRLRYVLLAGDGSVDYRNLLGYDEHRVPAVHVSTPSGLFPADNRYGDLDDDGLPEIAVGRIPVHTPAELDAVTDKLSAYAAQGNPPWANKVEMLADLPDGGANFSNDSYRAAALLGQRLETEHIHLADLPLAAARGQLTAALARGAGLINYFGHGGLDRLTAGGLLTNADVPGLANGAKLPFMTAMTCSLNRFTIPGVPSLGELLVAKSSGGASAVLGASGVPHSGDSRALALRMYGQPELLTDPQARLGDWVVNGYRKASEDIGDWTIFDFYNLLGDPSMKLVRGPEPVAPPGGDPGPGE